MRSRERHVLRMMLTLLLVVASYPVFGLSLEEAYQRDMDPVRIRHVEGIAVLMAEYFTKSGRLPLADRIQDKPIVVFVTHRLIARGLLDQAAKNGATVLTVDDLKADMEKVLGRIVDLPSDPQNFPSFAPNLYIYTVEPTRACIRGHLYSEAPNTEREGSFYKYQMCVRNSGFDKPLSPEESRHQRDADIFRARYLVEWAKIIEAYYDKAGSYPLQQRVEDDSMVRVRIATREQQRFLDPGDAKYARRMDHKDPRFKDVTVKELVAEIERVLEREIDERYDPQREPNGGIPTYINYFATKNGYLIWTACQTCPGRSNSFSTLLWSGTPSINIGSAYYVKNVRKTQSISSLQANTDFVEFVGSGPTRSELFEEIEHEHIHESKVR